MAEKQKEKKDFLILELTFPVEWQGKEIQELDMTKLREMTERKSVV